jgi:hypothetical protein
MSLPVPILQHDKFARHLSLANLKFPFPHMVSVMVDEGRTHAGTNSILNIMLLNY